MNWQVIFHKYKDFSSQKYRKELTPNITFQPNKTFVRNDLFGKIIKSFKATNLEFLKPKEKLRLCLYEDISDKKEFILMSKKIITQQLKEENKKLNVNENENENENKIVKDSNIKELKEEPKEIKSPNLLDKISLKKF